MLLALSHRAMHGYEISKFIEAKSLGFFRLPFGSLYPVLHRLEKANLIHAEWKALESQKPKKSYSLTAGGREALASELETFRSLSGAIGLLTPQGVM